MRYPRFIVQVAVTAALLPAFAGAQVVAITGGTVYPVSGPRIENGTVLIRDGKIAAVGANVAIPDGALRVDARGKWVTPGLIHALTSLGLGEGGSPEFSGGYSDGRARGTDGIAATFDAWRGLNPANTFIAPNRQEGVTSVGVIGGGGMIGGRTALIDLVEATSATAMLRKAPTAMLGGFGSPSAGTGARDEYWDKWRRLLDDVKAYQLRRAAYESGSTRTFETTQANLEALIPVVTGQLPLMLDVDRASDILAALDFAKQYNLKVWLANASEGWMVAKEIAAAKVPVFVGAMSDIPTSFDALGQRRENAAVLRAAGVTVVLVGIGTSGGGDFNVRNIRQEAGNAVAYGLSWDEALRAVTLTPAEVMGVAGSVGSLQVGRDANLVVWSGDPFEFSTRAEQVFVQGRTFETRSRQQQLTERYLTLPPSYRRP
ncbi:MAG: amidohydrolase family protein [Gemmatimonadetes bacterium]|nr:amidohydrolase family protein [Gemmatimonadota bacterium]